MSSCTGRPARLAAKSQNAQSSALRAAPGATATMSAVGQFGDHHDGLGLGAAADGERSGDRPALDTDAKGEGAHLRIFYVSRKRPTTSGHAAGVAKDLSSPCPEMSHNAAHHC